MVARLSVALVLSLVALVGCDRPAPETAVPSPVAARGGSDPHAVELAAQTYDAMGGAAGFADARYLRFNFVSVRGGAARTVARHLWDRRTDDYRVDGTTRAGQPYTVLFNLDRRDSGLTWLAGAPASDSMHTALLKSAYGRFVNDSYWLLMPTKLRDPGVTLTMAPDTTFGGQEYDVVHLSFSGVGLTPGDQYWAYLNRRTHLMDRWAMRLEDFAPTDTTAVYSWVDYARFGPLTLSPRKINPTTPGSEIRHDSLAVLTAVPTGVFTDPTVPLP